MQESGGEVIEHFRVVEDFSVTTVQHFPISVDSELLQSFSGIRITVPLLSCGLEPGWQIRAISISIDLIRHDRQSI